MYYEAVPHASVPVANAAEAARKIRSGKGLLCFHALIWKNSRGERIAAVADGGLDNPWAEVAVINVDTSRQLESITFAWIDDETTAIGYLQGCEDSHGLGACHLPLDHAGNDRPATFICSCCGTGFKSTIQEQRVHDQDQGYGYRPDCLKKYILPHVDAEAV
jgi:hypothetical protein